jgi:hypothetical protein
MKHVAQDPNAFVVAQLEIIRPDADKRHSVSGGDVIGGGQLYGWPVTLRDGDAGARTAAEAGVRIASGGRNPVPSMPYFLAAFFRHLQVGEIASDDVTLP